jgi:hypothetical protein
LPSPHPGQSTGQVRVVSFALQVPSPQRALQSEGHDVVVSPGPQRPSPQKLQSFGQLKGFSGETHLPSPHTVVGAQSMGQLRDVSGRTHCLSPQPPQSRGHVEGVSPVPHTPSPQGTTQSLGHVWVSPGAQRPSPQVFLGQSLGQVAFVSVVLQMPSPQRAQSSAHVCAVS